MLRSETLPMLPVVNSYSLIWICLGSEPLYKCIHVSKMVTPGFQTKQNRSIVDLLQVVDPCVGVVLVGNDGSGGIGDTSVVENLVDRAHDGDIVESGLLAFILQFVLSDGNDEIETVHDGTANLGLDGDETDMRIGGCLVEVLRVNAFGSRVPKGNTQVILVGDVEDLKAFVVCDVTVEENRDGSHVCEIESSLKKDVESNMYVKGC